MPNGILKQMQMSPTLAWTRYGIFWNKERRKAAIQAARSQRLTTAILICRANRPALPLRHFVSVGHDLGIALKYALRAAAQNQSYGLEVPELLQHIQMMPIQPLFLVYSECAETTFRSRITAELQSQIYPNWRVCDSKQSVLQGISALAEKPSFLVWLGPDDALHSSAFYSFASAINANPQVDVIYGDEDQFTGKGDRSNPFFKPDWSPDYLKSCNFLGGGTCVRGTMVDRFFGNSDGMYDFLLRTTEITQRIVHIRQVLVHRARGLDKPIPPDRITSDIAALEGRLKRTGRAGKVTALKRDIGATAFICLIQAPRRYRSSYRLTAGSSKSAAARLI